MKEVSKMTLGTVQLGLNYGIANTEGKPSTDKAYSILDKALEVGVNCFDTAAGYGDSEKVIGAWMKNRKIDRDSVSIVTKFKLGEIDEADVEKTVVASIESSLDNLGTDYVDYLFMHKASEYEKYSRQIDIAIEKLMNRGYIKAAGASGYAYAEIRNIVKNDMYSAFQIPVNLLDHRLTDDEKYKLMSKTIFARSIYLQGLFFMNTKELYGNIKEATPFIKKARELADEYGFSMSRLAMGYVNSLVYVDSLVVGADNAGHVSDNMKLLKFPKFAGDMLYKIKTELEGAPDWLFYPMLWDKKEG